MRLSPARSGILALALPGLLCACSSAEHGAPTAGTGGASTVTSSGAGASGSGSGGDGGTAVDVCSSLDNPPGTVVSFPWPNPVNDGHDALESQTVHFAWTDGQPHNVLEIAHWEGQDAPLGPEANAGWPGELYSGPKTVNGSFDWNTGAFPCGWRPGLYYLADEDNPTAGITAVSLTVPEGMSHYYDPKPCSALAEPGSYGGRYASYASRAGCTQYEVNNFQTEAHYDWVAPTFQANQGDAVLFRWTGLHNVVQVHDQSKDEPYLTGGIVSGPRTNCVGGPSYTCANGSAELGEYLIDTASYRPGMIHLSDQCAYGCAGCPVACDNTTNTMMYSGTPMLLFLSRPVRPAPPVAGACCAIDKTKGQACRVVDLYNDNAGTQFDSGLGGGITVNRGDLVRFRWAGSIKLVQTTATTTTTGVASQNPLPGGVAMSAAVECVPGPNWTCLGGNTDQAELIFDVDSAMAAGHFQTFSYGGDFIDFYAFADNSDDPYMTTQSSGIVLPIGQGTPYADNPACP